MRWIIDKFPNDKTPCLTVQCQLENNVPKKTAGAEAEKTAVSLQELVNVHANFSVAGVGTSGIKVETLQVRNEKYKPSQGGEVSHEGWEGRRADMMRGERRPRRRLSVLTKTRS